MISRIRKVVVGVTGASLALALGCSSKTTNVTQVVSDGHSDGGLGVLPSERSPRVDEIRRALRPVAEAQCKHWFACCTEGERALQIGHDMKDAPACADILVEMAEYGTTNSGYSSQPLPSALSVMKYLEYGFDFSRVSVDAAAVTACAKNLSESPCNAVAPLDHCEPTPLPPADDPCALSKLFIGKGKVGEDCVRTLQYSSSIDCAPGLSCVSVDAIHGVCVEAPADGMLCGQDYDCRDTKVCDHTSGRCVDGLDVDAACSYTDKAHPVQGTETTPCRRGLICDTQKFKCADARCAAGTSCSQDSDCAVGLLCVGNVCGPLGAIGKNCNSDTQCESHLCRPPPSNTGNYVCAAPKAEGAACQSDTECASQFCTSSGTSATCTKQAKPGEPCPSASDSQCAGGHCIPDAGSVYTCVATGKEGDTCTVPADCDTKTGLSCVKSVCSKPPFADDSPCPTGSDEVCTSKFCDGTTCRARAKVTEPCSNLHSPDGAPPCETSLYCDFSDPSLPSGTCVARKASGDPCTTDGECRSGCQPIAGVRRCVDYSQRVALCTGTGAK